MRKLTTRFSRTAIGRGAVELALRGVKWIAGTVFRLFNRAYTPKEFLRGLLIYAAGDTVATLILGSFSETRVLGVMCVGAFVYSFEIPRYFRWIEALFSQRTSFPWRCARAVVALAYFNPLWIARHYVFIELSSGRWDRVDWELLSQAVRSFVVLAPLSMLGNYSIQNCLSLRWRFFASALMSGLFAVAYALFHG